LSFSLKRLSPEPKPRTSIPPLKESLTSTLRTPVSERKRDANRVNAQHSTGPRTEQGKGNSSKNALKHGLLAADAVNSHLADPGDRAQFDQLVDQMQRLYQPVGLMEELMVQKIAIAAWRL